MKTQTRRDKKGRLILIGGAVLLVGGLMIPAIAAVSGSSTDEQIQALDEEYAARASAIPNGSERGPALTALNDQYEKDFAKIGSEAPNGPDPSLAPSDYERNLVPTGMHDAKEDPAGYTLTNYWAQELPDGGVIFVAGASVEGDSKVGGVYLVDDRGEGFFPSPTAAGPLTIKDVSGTTVSLATDSGSLLQFDYASREFA